MERHSMTREAGPDNNGPKTTPATGRSREKGLLSQLGRFRERFQVLTSIQTELHGSRSKQEVLRNIQNVVVSTLGAQAAWLLDGRMGTPRPLTGSIDPFPQNAHAAVTECLRTGRTVTLKLPHGEDGSPASGAEDTLYLVPLRSGGSAWGALALRMREPSVVDAETLRFLGLVGELMGPGIPPVKDRAAAEAAEGRFPAVWLSLTALPGRVVLISGEAGTDKRTFAERLQSRFVGGPFQSLELTGGEEDLAKVEAALAAPGLRSLYIHDILRASPESRTLLHKATEKPAAPVLFLATSTGIWPPFPDALLSRAATVGIRLPALREQPEEISRLVEMALARRGITIKVAPAAKRLLMGHPWPDNDRELDAFIDHVEQVLRLEGGKRLTAPVTRRLLGSPPWMPLTELIQDYEAQVLHEAMRRSGGNKAAVARLLNITPRQVGYKCRKYGFPE